MKSMPTPPDKLYYNERSTHFNYLFFFSLWNKLSFYPPSPFYLTTGT